MNKYSSELNRLTEIIIKPELDFGELKKAADSLYYLFLKIAELKEDSEGNRNHIYLSTGKAIGPVWAAMCIKEFMRTRKFLRGIYKGIQAAKERFRERPVRILYAGTGPFATLAVPFTSVFSSDDIKFTFLEINDNSISHLKKVIETLKIENYIDEIIQCDATQFKADDSKPIHMIISETMLNALQREPQAAITMNLVPQMVENGILIPQSIKISAIAMDPARNNDRIMGDPEAEKDYCMHLGDVFELDRDTALFMNSRGSDSLYDFPDSMVEIPWDMEARYKQLCLFTEINIFEDEVLASWQCSLTLPKHIVLLDQLKAKGSKVRFKYVLNENPHFDWSIV